MQQTELPQCDHSTVATKCSFVFHSFAKYFISTACKKMNTHMEHAVSCAYFQCLCSITTNDLEQAIQTYGGFQDTMPNHHYSVSSLRRDLDLCHTLLSQGNGIPHLIQNYLYIQYPNVSLENLTNALWQPCDSQSSGNTLNPVTSQHPFIYTKNTAKEFYFLLVSVLAGFITSLEFFLQACTKLNVTPAELDNTYVFIIMLW